MPLLPGLRKLCGPPRLQRMVNRIVSEFVLLAQGAIEILPVVITGPTATGKTALALALADRFPCHLISVDSSLVYRQMNIGTAKPDAQTLKNYPHGLVDIRDIQQTYSAGDFVEDARREISLAVAAGKIPLLVGGTQLYLRALFRGLAEMPTANPQLRLELAAEAQTRGWAALYADLTRLDPLAAKKIAPADRQRIQRALEVYRLTGRPISDWQKKSVGESGQVQPLLQKIVLAPHRRQDLHQQIARRSAAMIESGLIDEVTALRSQGQIDDLPAMRAVGYRQVIDHLCGRIDQAQLTERITVATRQLAKRQLTWLRGDPGGTWFDPGNSSTLDRVSRLVAASMNLP